MFNRKAGIVSVVCLLLAVAVAFSVVAANSKTDAKKEYEVTGNSVLYEMGSNRHTQYIENTAVTCLITTDGFEPKLENDLISVWYRKESASLRVVDKRTGYVWGCTASDHPENLNKSWSATANSICTVRYFDKKNAEQTAPLSSKDWKFMVNWSNNKAKFSVKGKKLGISFEFLLKLDGASLTFQLDDKSIKETGKNKFASVTFMQFFGSVEQDKVPGYFMLPDGSGALIRFKKSQNYSAGFEKKIYGTDLSIDKSKEQVNLNGNRTDDYATEENQVMLPVYGIVHGENQNAVFVTVNSGAEYTFLNAIPAGVSNVDYNWAAFKFVYRSLFDKRVSNSKTVNAPQDNKNKVNVSLTYNFLCGDDANYSGMARFYREKLTKEKVLNKKSNKDSELPLLVNVMASEVKKGFLSNSLSVLTSSNDATKIVKDLKKSGINNLTLLLSGWISGGYNGSDFASVSFEKEVGTEKEIKALKDRVVKQGGRFALAVNTVTANKDQINITRHAALNASENAMVVETPNRTLMYPSKYFIKTSRTLSYIDEINSKLNDFGILYESLAKYLYADYTPDLEYSRSEAQKAIVKAVSKSKRTVMTDCANLYMLPITDAIVQMPVTNSQYLYETDSIPFLQMVLRGSIDYYAPYSNQGFYSDFSILKMIEYGSYPSFLVMNADNFELYNTPIADYFSLCYKDWKSTINDVYSKVSNALKSVQGAQMLSHTVLSDGVYKVAYDNGIFVYLNYNNTNYTLPDGTVISAINYAIKEN